jgi:hypothetical protein
MPPPEDGQPALIDLAAGRVARTVSTPERSWREIELGGRFPIHAVVWTPAGPHDPAADVSVMVSQDGATWFEPGVASRAVAPRAVTIGLVAGETAWARAVRVSLPDTEAAGTVSVQCAQAAVDLIALRATLGLGVKLRDETPGANVYASYVLVGGAGRTSGSLVGLAPFENGAFGNCLVQYIITIAVAKALNLKYIALPKADRSKVIFLRERFTCDGITFIPSDEPLPPDGYFLSGLYFDPTQFDALIGPRSPPDSRAIVRDVVRPLFNGLPAVIPGKPDDQLLIHIRSGDIFSTWVDPHYPQPPFAFYRMVIDRLLGEKRIRSVKLVFENRLNPVIAEVEAYAHQRGLPVEIQSESLVADVTALVNGRYLVFGLGTFGPAICHLSDRVEQVFYFASNWPQGFQAIPTIGKVVEVRDVENRYIKVGAWQNTEDQRRMMVTYPAQALAFDDA